MNKFLLSTLFLACSSTLVYGAEKIASIEIEGNTVIPHDALMLNLQANGITEGEELDYQGLSTFKKNVKDHYQYFRRYAAHIDTLISPVDDDHVAVKIVINEYNANAVDPSLAPLPYDEDVYKDPEPVVAQARDQEALEELEGQEALDKEEPEGILSLGVGYGNRGTLFRASFIKHKFMGTDASVRLTGMRDRYESNVSLSYSKPNFFRPNMRFEAELFYDTFNHVKSKTIAPYRRRSYGVSTLLHFKTEGGDDFYGGLRYTRNHLDRMTPEYSRALYISAIPENKWAFASNDFDFLAGWKTSTLNKKFLPTKGMRVRVDGSISLPGSDNHYYKINLDAEGYVPLNDKHSWLLSARASLGYADGFDGHEVPFYQNYTAGGSETIRGFAYGAIGPKAIYSANGMQGVSTNPRLYSIVNNQVVGGNALASGSLALIMPSFFVPKEYQPMVRTSLFFDVANVWNTKGNNLHPQLMSNGNSHRVRMSSGIAIEWKFPIGVLSASYAIPIKKYPGDRTERFQISLSGSF